MSGFSSSQTGDFDRYFMTTTELIDNYAQGGLWMCGYNSMGGLGTNNLIHKSSPVQTIAGGINWKSISLNRNAAAIKTDGTLWVWGNNDDGELGTNSSVWVRLSSPVQTVCGGTNWKLAATSVGYIGYHTAAIKTDGTLWLWGNNSSGELGDNTTIKKSSPVQTVAGGTNWKLVSVERHTAAIKNDGTLWVWGENYTGQLGTNDRVNRQSPVQTVCSGINWKLVSAGNDYTAAIKTDGTLWLWGNNSFGQLGTNDITDRSSPAQTVTGGTNWKSVSTGQYHIAAIKTDGTLWLWGYNPNGQLGTNNLIHRSSPVQTVAGGTNWKSVACGFDNSGAIKTDGTLWLWGENSWGQLGTNNRTHRSSPVQTVAGGTNWKSVACGYRNTAALQYSDIGQVL